MHPASVPTRRRHRLPTALVVSTTVALLIGLVASGDQASGRDSENHLPEVGSLVPDETLDSRIIGLDLTGAVWTSAVGKLDAALFTRAEITRRLASSRSTLLESRTELTVIGQNLALARASEESIADEVAALEEVLRARALALFVGHGGSEIVSLGSARDAVDETRISLLAAEAAQSQFEIRDALLEQGANLTNELSALGGRRLELNARIASLTNAIAMDQRQLVSLEEEIEQATGLVRSARRQAHIPGMDFSVVALDAYLRAETLQAEADPECRLEWWMIAGIGRVESRHGEFGGRSIRADGRTTSEIIGVALDGIGVQAVIDTDAGVLDSDTQWDRAVGPMQFIPETWRIRSRDANGDSVADPHNIYDAAYTTARYVCRLGGDLSDRASLRQAYFGYNASTSYVDDVERHALRYRELELTPVEARTEAKTAAVVGDAVDKEP